MEHRKGRWAVVLLGTVLLGGLFLYGAAFSSVVPDVHALNRDGDPPALGGGVTCTGNMQVGVGSGSGSNCAAAAQEAIDDAWANCKVALASDDTMCTPAADCKPAGTPPETSQPPNFSCNKINGVWSATASIDCHTACVPIKKDEPAPAPSTGGGGHP